MVTSLATEFLASIVAIFPLTKRRSRAPAQTSVLLWALAWFCATIIMLATSPAIASGLFTRIASPFRTKRLPFSSSHLLRLFCRPLTYTCVFRHATLPLRCLWLHLIYYWPARVARHAPDQNNSGWKLSRSLVADREYFEARSPRRCDDCTENARAGGIRPRDRRRADAVRPQPPGNQRHGRLFRFEVRWNSKSVFPGGFRPFQRGSIGRDGCGQDRGGNSQSSSRL